MDSPEHSIEGKYQKLAGEYAKLKAQNVVLKKAVIEEQTTNASNKESLRVYQQNQRKSEQEIESLTFRNQQLAKRVEMFQVEADNPIPKKQKNKIIKPEVSVNNELIEGELRAKIAETARLHSKVAELETAHTIETSSLRELVTSLEDEVLRQQKDSLKAQEHNLNEIEKLKAAKARLELNLQGNSVDLQDSKRKSDHLERISKEAELDLRTKLHSANSIIKDKLMFIDSSNNDMNSINVPTFDRSHQMRARGVLTQMGGHISQLASALSNYHTYWEQRVQISIDEYGENQSNGPHKKFKALLHENQTYLRPMQESYQILLSSLEGDVFLTLQTISGLKGFSEKFAKYVSFLKILTPYYILSIEEECNSASCPESLVIKNKDLIWAIKQLTSNFSRLETYVRLLAQQSECSCKHPLMSQKKMLSQLTAVVNDTHKSIKSMSRIYTSKLKIENETATATEKLRCTDECILSSLVSLVTCFGKISTLLTENLDFIQQDAGYKTRGSSVSQPTSPNGIRTHPNVGYMRKRGTNFLNQIHFNESESVNYAEALSNKNKLHAQQSASSSAEQQLTTLQERVANLEKQKEHWMLEYQLLNIKFQKEQQKTEGMVLSEVNSEKAQEELRARAESTACQKTMLGTLEVADPQELISREDEIRNYYSTRLGEMMSKLQDAESKALAFQTESIDLLKRLKLAEEHHTSLRTELSQSQNIVTELTEELQTTAQNYTQQLSAMSEHLANMNEMLAQKEDEIEQLKYSSSNKITRKIKGLK